MEEFVLVLGRLFKEVDKMIAMYFQRMRAK